MNSKRGFVNVWVVIGLVIVLGVGFLVWKVKAPQTLSQSETQQEANTIDVTVGPQSGSAPLSVSFAIRKESTVAQSIDFGDGSMMLTSELVCGLQFCSKNHIYTKAGTYTAKYLDASKAVLKSFSIVVQGEGTSSQIPTATIDPISLQSDSGTPKLSGTVSSKITNLMVSIYTYNPQTQGGDLVWGSSNSQVTLASGKWSVSITNAGASSPWSLSAGTYQVVVDGTPRTDSYVDFHGANYKPLTSGLLTVSSKTVVPLHTQKYSNAQYGFSLEYPSDMTIPATLPSQSIFMSGIAGGIPVILIGSESAGVLVVASNNASDVQNCMTPPTSSGESSTPPQSNTVSFSGTTFMHYVTGDVGAGMFSRFEIYKALRNGTCFAVSGRMSGASPTHFSGEEAIAVQKTNDALIAKMDNIVKTFQFAN